MIGVYESREAHSHKRPPKLQRQSLLSFKILLFSSENKGSALLLPASFFNMLYTILNLSLNDLLDSIKGVCMSLFKKINAIALVFILFFLCNIVYAQESNLKNPESKIGERIDFLQASFDKGQTRAEVWSYGWMGLYGAATGIQTYLAINSSHGRVSNIVGASESFLGLAVLIIVPFNARSSGSDLREIAGSTPEEQKNKLAKAENWLERNYKQEKLGRSWLSHLGVLAVSIIGAGIVWHYNGSKNGIISALTGVAGGEALIWTQPSRGIRDYHDYHSKYKDFYDGIPEKKYFIAPSRNGFVVGVYF